MTNHCDSGNHLQSGHLITFLLLEITLYFFSTLRVVGHIDLNTEKFKCIFRNTKVIHIQNFQQLPQPWWLFMVCLFLYCNWMQPFVGIKGPLHFQMFCHDIWMVRHTSMPVFEIDTSLIAMAGKNACGLAEFG